MIDHRNSPGLTEEQARRLGYDPLGVREGGMLEAPTLGCCHCGAVVMLNPNRKRPRNYCQKCNRYICDGCAAVAHESDYVHRTFNEICDLVVSGKFTVSGSASRPVLTPKGDGNG